MRTHPKSINGSGNLPSSSVGTRFQRHGNRPYKMEDKIWTFCGLWHKPEEGPDTVETSPAGVSQPGLTTVLCVVLAAGMDVITASGTGSVCGRALPEPGPGRSQAEMHLLLVNTDPHADYGFTFNALHLGRWAAWTAGIFPREIQDLQGYTLPAEWCKKPKKESPDKATLWSQASLLLVLTLHSKIDIKITELPFFF